MKIVEFWQWMVFCVRGSRKYQNTFYFPAFTFETGLVGRNLRFAWRPYRPYEGVCTVCSTDNIQGTCKMRNVKNEKETKRKHEKKTVRKVTKKSQKKTKRKKRKQNNEKRNETKEKETKRQKCRETKWNEKYESLLVSLQEKYITPKA